MYEYLTLLKQRKHQIYHHLNSFALPEQQILFCALCCERLEPIYKVACQVHKAYSHELLICLKHVWHFLSGKPIDIEIWQADMEKLYSANPYEPSQVKPFWDSLGSYYIKAVYHTINLCELNRVDDNLTKLVSEATVAATSSYVGDITSFTENLVGLEYEDKVYEWIFTSPPVDLEFMKQESDVEKIKTLQNNLVDHIDEMREWNRTFGINPYKLGVLNEE